MAHTLAEAAKLSNDLVLEGVFENTVNVDPVLFNTMEWEKVEGNAVKYSRENALPSVADFAVGDAWTEGVGTFTQITTALTIVGGDADVDQYLQLTRSNVNDQKAVIIANKAKALGYGLSDRFVYGLGTANQMSGLHTLVTAIAAQQIHQGAAGVGAALSLANLDALIDLIRVGKNGRKPDLLIMNRNLRRRISQFGRGAASSIVETRELFGKQVMHFGEIPIAVNDFLTQTETIAGGVFTLKTGGATSSIFACSFGPDAMQMLYGGPSPIIVEDVGVLETKDATRTRIKSYPALALYSTLAVARLDGITDAAAVV